MKCINAMQDLAIGILGGMGTFATIHAFSQYANVFQAEKEWDRPRLVIDNRCTMPSRVRAFLYDEKKDQLVDEMINSLKHLRDMGCTKIFMACNTSYLFFPLILKKAPELGKYILNIIEICVKQIIADNITEVFLIGSEGTIASQVYQKEFNSCGGSVTCLFPQREEYIKLRQCIEAVKQNKYTSSTRSIFLDLVNRFDNVILGCTELPILYERYKEDIICTHVYDPVLITIKTIKKEFERNS